MMGKLVEDSTKEQEFFPENKELGFLVSEFYDDGTVTHYHNVTEVHWRLHEGAERAYESDIHSTGNCWYYERGGKSVTLVAVINAKEISNRFTT